MATEYELKFSARPAVLEQLLRSLGKGGRALEMRTTYYDTPGGQLSRRQYTLRRRLENGQSVCTLKAPADGGARGEWELPCDDILQAVPGLCAMGAPGELPELVREGLEPVCCAAFRRIAVDVVSGGSRLELALDRGTLSGGGREMPLCEVEVELKEGSREDARDFAADLARAYGLQPEHKSKFARALALAKGE